MEQIWDNLPAVAGFAVPFLLVLGLVGLAALLWQRFRTATGSPTSRRGKQSRLAVIDTAAVDARRRLVLIRRDDAEHLIMIGGPTDIVIEPNIGQSEAFSPAREAPAAASPDRPVRRPQSAAAPASPAFEAWSGPRPDPVQAAAREPIVIPQQELRQEAGQRIRSRIQPRAARRADSPTGFPKPPRAGASGRGVGREYVDDAGSRCAGPNGRSAAGPGPSGGGAARFCAGFFIRAGVRA